MAFPNGPSLFTLDEESRGAVDAFYDSEIDFASFSRADQDFVTLHPGHAAQTMARAQQKADDIQENPYIARLATAVLKATDIAQYTNLFDVTVEDVIGRIFRACVPYRGLLDPPPPPPPPQAQTAEQVDDETLIEPASNSRLDPDDDVEHSDSDQALAPANVGEKQVPPVITSVASQKPFNNKDDLYGPFWLTTTLVLSVAVASNTSALVMATASSPHRTPADISSLTALDFRNVVHAASTIYIYVLGTSFGLAAAKRYVVDPEEATVLRILCVYGYATAPLIPAVLMCSFGNSLLAWSALLLAAALSAWTIVKNIWPRTRLLPCLSPDRTDSNLIPNQGDGASTRSISVATKRLWFLKCTTAGLHLFLVVVLKLRFF